MEPAGEVLAEVAAATGAADIFVFRRVRRDRYVHLGGLGHGVGWAGIIEFDLADEPLARAAVEGGVPLRITRARANRIVGPYYAPEAVLVAMPPDGLVVFGPSLPSALGNDALQAAAARAAELIGHVSPAKRLADELEVLHAVKALGEVEPSDVAAVARHAVAVATESLSCELGVLYVPLTGTLAVCARSWPLPDEAEIEAGMQSLAARREELPSCFQDAAEHPLPAPFGPGAGVRSYLALAIDAPGDAVLLVMHTDAAPRGFTLLCQQLGQRLAEAAVPLLRMAFARQQLSARVEDAQRAARRDSLTGVGNRLAWDEALSAHPAGTPAGVLVVDVNGMKAANDRVGHHAGDELLQEVADAVRANVRPEDAVARIGGDEIAVLLQGLDEAGAEAAAGRIEAALAVRRTPSGLVPSAAIGAAACPPCADLRAALRSADERMYARKPDRTRAPR